MRDYTNALNQEGISGDLSGGITGDAKTLTGAVLRIQSVYDGSQTQYHILVEGMENKIMIATSTLSAELSLTQVGDMVKVSYYDTIAASPIVSVTAFDNLELSVS